MTGFFKLISLFIDPLTNVQRVLTLIDIGADCGLWEPRLGVYMHDQGLMSDYDCLATLVVYIKKKKKNRRWASVVF